MRLIHEKQHQDYAEKRDPKNNTDPVTFFLKEGYFLCNNAVRDISTFTIYSLLKLMNSKTT